jgi:tetratricopeptide (TPR) repeat protein
MPPIEDYQHTLLAAQGYCELGMFADALAELETLPKALLDHPMVVEARLIVLMTARRWAEALAAAVELTKLIPGKNIGYIHTAYCQHELGQTAQARDTLLGGPESLHSEAVYHYNLACYECRLGNHDLARAHLDKSFALDKSFRELAKNDTDLTPLHEEL